MRQKKQILRFLLPPALIDQKRITLTGKVINNASEIIFLVTGANKADKVKSVIEDENEAFILPAKKIKPVNGYLSWYLDKEAASYIERS